MNEWYGLFVQEIRMDEAFFWEAFLKGRFAFGAHIFDDQAAHTEMPRQQCLQPECPARKEKEEMTGKRILAERT